MKYVCLSRDLSSVVGPFPDAGAARQWANANATHTGTFGAITFSGWLVKSLTPAMQYQPEAPPADV